MFILSFFSIILLIFIGRQEGRTILDSFIIGVHRHDEVVRPLSWAALYFSSLLSGAVSEIAENHWLLSVHLGMSKPPLFALFSARMS